MASDLVSPGNQGWRYLFRFHSVLGIVPLLSSSRAIPVFSPNPNAFGLGEKTGIALDDERSGTIPSTEWKRKRYRQPWFPGETVSVAIGQGYVTVTPLQLANMMAAVANGGKLYRPYVVNKVESVDGTTVREYGPELIRTIELKPDTLKRVRAALTDVVSAPHGTGAAARSQLVSIAGKTGTAQVVEMKG